MASLEIPKLKQNLRKRLGHFVNTDSKRLNPHLHGVLDEIRKSEYPAFLCGGAVRDMLLHNNLPRDLDIILGYVSNDQLETLFSPFVKGRTGLGGLKLQIKDWSVDMWPIQNTWAFKEGKYSGSGFSDYPKVTFLNIDAIAVQLFTSRKKKRIIYSKGFFEAISTKTIELNFEDNPNPTKCIARALHMANNYKYALGPKLSLYIMSHLKQMEIEELVRIYQRRYMSAYVTIEVLSNCMKSIQTQLNTSTKTPVNISFEQDNRLIGRHVNPSKINHNLFV